MRDDLSSFVPYFSQNELLLCPVCLRRLRFEDFTLEHIIPLQALADDPAAARTVIPANQRSGGDFAVSKATHHKKKEIYNQGATLGRERITTRLFGKFFDPGNPALIRPVWEALNRITPARLLGEGRVYGGGLHKLEPKELASVPVPEIAALLPAALRQIGIDF